MSDIIYENLRFIVADDFNNFRRTVNDMLGKLGVSHIEMAEKGATVLELCKHRQFDVILCDYDLGSGKNGQQVLEELRFKGMISRKTLFVMVSADSSKEVVMASYDYEPDDYLMKPITGRMLHQRLQRLLAQRNALMPVYDALDGNDKRHAIALLTELASKENRQAVPAQKLLGELLIESGDLARAELLYTKALQVRPLDWARLGLAKVKHLRGELDVARNWLQNILKDNPLYLPAYDVLADNWYAKGDREAVQEAIQRSVQISPRSILRQKRLAEVAELNGDLPVALTALRQTIKLGEQSCHGTVEDSFNYARVANSSIDSHLDSPQHLGSEVLEVLARARHRFSLNPQQLLRSQFLEGRTQLAMGNREGAKEILEAAIENSDHDSLALDIERLQALRALGESDKAALLQRELLTRHGGDEAALEQLDLVLDEPSSEINRELVAAINQEGIDLYNRAKFDEALTCFARAGRIFPKHLGIQLNIVQSLVGKLRVDRLDEQTRATLKEKMIFITQIITPEHAQYPRYLRLKTMFESETRGR